jgi:hypothetical protein
MTGKFTDSELAGLSEAEREAIAGTDEGDPAAVAAAAAAAGGEEASNVDADPNFGADVGAGTADTAAASTAADTAAAAAASDEAASAAATAAAGDAPVVVDTAFTPSFHIEGPENYAATMEAMKAERSAFTAKFKEGEISVEELLEGQAQVDEKITALREHQFASELTATLTEQNNAQRWKLEQDIFMEANKQYVENKILRSALNTAVVDIAKIPENANKPGSWVLQEAHKAVQEAMGIKTPSPTAEEAAAAAAAAAAKLAGRKPNLTAVPKTLANLPAADIQATGVDEFAALDRLEGVELEQALAKLTPDQEARYLRASG